MPKSQNQKMKLLYLMNYLLRYSDENHPVSVKDMIAELGKHDISAERKAIYEDLELLSRFGLDIVRVQTNKTGYYVASREFEIPELKLLVDSVQSSKFITQNKTMSLISKIEGLASTFDASRLQRQVYVRNRIKSMNESVYYNVDAISDAISADSKIQFRYFDYDMHKEKKFRHDGAYYKLSPYALIWDDENYYLLAYDNESGKMKHFRVDKMNQISSLNEKRDGRETFEKIDMSSYTKKVFSMFTGEEKKVTLRFAKHLAGVAIDRFGQDIIMVPDGEEAFTVSVNIVVSPQFYAWLFGLGNEAEIVFPPDVREGMRSQIDSVNKLYKKE